MIDSLYILLWHCWYCWWHGFYWTFFHSYCYTTASRTIQFHFHLVCCFASYILDGSINYQFHCQRFFDLKGRTSTAFVFLKVTRHSQTNGWLSWIHFPSRAHVQTVELKTSLSLGLYFQYLAAALKILWNAQSKFLIVPSILFIVNTFLD